MASGNTEFLETVQLHERAWGNNTYQGKPDLLTFLNAKIVVFWQLPKDDRWQASIHPDMSEVEEELTKMLMRLSVSLPKRTIARIFANQRRVCITGMKVKFEYCDNTKN